MSERIMDDLMEMASEVDRSASRLSTLQYARKRVASMERSDVRLDHDARVSLMSATVSVPSGLLEQLIDKEIEKESTVLRAALKVLHDWSLSELEKL